MRKCAHCDKETKNEKYCEQCQSLYNAIKIAKLVKMDKEIINTLRTKLAKRNKNI